MHPLVPTEDPHQNQEAPEPLHRGRNLERTDDGAPQALPPPAARAIAIAQSDPSPLPSDFQPTSAHRALAGALFESKASTFLELAEKSGISRAHIYRILEDSQAVKWIVANSAKAHQGALPAVYTQLLHKALNDKGTAAIRLFLERFDSDFKPKEGAALSATNMQINFQGYSTAELEKMVNLKTRAVLGAPIPPKDDRASQRP